MLSNYSIPINFSKLIQKNERLDKCDLEASIRYHIYLLLITRFDDWRYDSGYGCILWRYDFDTRATLKSKKQEIERSVKERIEKHERRLGELRVSFKITQEELIVRGFKSLLRPKERLEIKVSGRILETNQLFNPAPFIIYFSPILTGTQ